MPGVDGQDSAGGDGVSLVPEVGTAWRLEGVGRGGKLGS